MPHVSRFFARPTTSIGRWAGWSALIAFASLIASAIITNAFEREDPGAVYDVTKPIIIAIFALSGFSALALSVRSLMLHERSCVVWAALVVGLFATGLMIAEFTILE